MTTSNGDLFQIIPSFLMWCGTQRSFRTIKCRELNDETELWEDVPMDAAKLHNYCATWGPNDRRVKVSLVFATKPVSSIVPDEWLGQIAACLAFSMSLQDFKDNYIHAYCYGFGTKNTQGSNYLSKHTVCIITFGGPIRINVKPAIEGPVPKTALTETHAADQSLMIPLRINKNSYVIRGNTLQSIFFEEDTLLWMIEIQERQQPAKPAGSFDDWYVIPILSLASHWTNINPSPP